MLWGINYDSLGILIERYFLDNPNYAKHFFAGYGYNPITDDYNKLKLALIKAGFASLMNGLKTNNRRWETLGRRMLEAICFKKL